MTMGMIKWRLKEAPKEDGDEDLDRRRCHGIERERAVEEEGFYHSGEGGKFEQLVRKQHEVTCITRQGVESYAIRTVRAM
ncbi:hypothetical protein B296_00056675 [Ensete ventricosum]|uniref:Uncharacterized protein n=1 Tax=Ensete ventricosum TaxID=4639 RepID=A0A426XJ33_ENSVE|nr:hypothetical protein B296_00056675 [Ensete ventricosum]